MCKILPSALIVNHNLSHAEKCCEILLDVNHDLAHASKYKILLSGNHNLTHA